MKTQEFSEAIKQKYITHDEVADPPPIVICIIYIYRLLK